RSPAVGDSSRPGRTRPVAEEEIHRQVDGAGDRLLPVGVVPDGVLPGDDEAFAARALEDRGLGGNLLAAILRLQVPLAQLAVRDGARDRPSRLAASAARP